MYSDQFGEFVRGYWGLSNQHQINKWDVPID